MQLDQSCTAVLMPELHLAAKAQYAAVLRLSGAALDELVEHELVDNPALERDDTAASRRIPAVTTGQVPDWPAVAAGDDARETLRREARLGVCPADRPVIDYVVASLDDRGRLTASASEIADALGVTVARAARATTAVRAAGPPGVAAEDLRDCLLLQLDDQLTRADADTAGDLALARRVVDRHLNDLATGRHAAVARALNVSTTDIRRAGALVRASLRPCVPLDAPAWPPRAAPSADAIRPDVVFMRTQSALRVMLPEEARHRLVLADSYRLAGGDHADRARRLLHRLQQRWTTMRAITEELAARQMPFLLGQSDAASPLSRADVARAIGVHESTVSRAVIDRWALTPPGRLLPLARLFGDGVPARDEVRRLIAVERRPRTDSELAALATAAGYPIARRTVAKYRAELGIPTCARRRRAAAHTGAGLAARSPTLRALSPR